MKKRTELVENIFLQWGIVGGKRRRDYDGLSVTSLPALEAQDSFCKNASLRKVKEARKQKMSPRNITTQIHLNVDNINSGMGDYATEKNKVPFLSPSTYTDL